MPLSNKLKIARQKSFLSQDAFAKEVKVSVSTINRWETGKSKPNLNAMKQLKAFCLQHELNYDEIEADWLDIDLEDKE